MPPVHFRHIRCISLGPQFLLIALITINNTVMVILGISIGTRSSGIAILEGNQLKAWNTISFKASWSEEKGDAIIKYYEQYIKKHNVKIVIVKIPRISHHTDAIVNLLQKVQKMITYH